MPLDKLYVKIKCPTCKGSKIFNHGAHFPIKPYKWKTCPYCDTRGEVYIEAAHTVILEYLESLSEDKKQEILLRLSVSLKTS